MEKQKTNRAQLIGRVFLSSIGFIALIVAFRHYSSDPSNSATPACSAPQLDTKDWQQVNVDLATFKLPEGFVATEDHDGIHGTIYKFLVGKCKITYYPGFYHFSPPNGENKAIADNFFEYDKSVCRSGNYEMRVVNYQTSVPGMRLHSDHKYHFDNNIKYHVYADWSREIESYPPSYNRKSCVAYMMADSADRAGQVQALAIIQTMEINPK